jgi:hypothetical protein
MRVSQGQFLLAALLLSAPWLHSQDTTPKTADAGPAPARSPNSTAADMAIPLCPATFNDSLATDGIADRHEVGVKGPRPIHTVPPEMSNEARRALRDYGPWDFVVVLSAVVGVNGDIQDVCLRRSAGYGLDASAAQGAMNYRFSPALKDGKPVPWRLTDEVSFRGGR